MNTRSDAEQVIDLVLNRDPGESGSASIEGLLPVVGPNEIEDAPALGEMMTEDDFQEIVIAADGDAESRRTKWLRRFKDARQRKSFENAYHLLYRYGLEGTAHLYQVSGEPGGDCSLEEDDNDDWMLFGNKFNLPLARPLMEEIQSRLNFSGTVYKAYPRTSAQHDVVSARTATSVARHLSGTKAWKKYSNRRALISPLHGWSATKVEWDKFARVSVKNSTGNTSTEMDGDPTIEVFAPYALMYPPGISDLEEASWMADVTQKPWSWLRERYPDKAKHQALNPQNSGPDEDWFAQDWFFGSDLADNIYEGWGVKKTSSNVAYIPAGLSSQGAPGQPLLVVSCYERAYTDELGPVIIKTVYCRGVELESYPLMPMSDQGDGKYRVKIQPNGKPKTFGMPYHIVRYFETPDVFEGRGVMSVILDLMVKIAEQYALLLKNSKDATTNFMFHGHNDSMTPWYSPVFTLVKYQHNIPKVHKLSPQFQELIFLVNKLEATMNTLAMMPDVKRGVLPGSGTSGKALQTLSAENDGGFGNIRLRHVNADAAVITAYLEQMQWNATLPRILFGVGKNDGTGALIFEGMDLEGTLDVRGSLESELPSDPTARINFANIMASLGIITDPEELWNILKPDGSLEEADTRGPNDDLAMQFINNILSFDKAEAEAYWWEMIRSMRAKAEEAILAGGDVAQAVSKARADALAHINVGIDPYMDPARQALRTEQYLLDLQTIGLPVEHKALIVERWMALSVAAGGGVTSEQEKPDQPRIPLASQFGRSEPEPQEPSGRRPMSLPGSMKSARPVSVSSFGGNDSPAGESEEGVAL